MDVWGKKTQLSTLFEEEGGESVSCTVMIRTTMEGRVKSFC